MGDPVELRARAARWSRAMASLVVLGAVVLGCGDDDDPGPTDGAEQTSTPESDAGDAVAPVTIDVVGVSEAYEPGEVTVRAGQEVVWTNQDGISHTVTEVDGGFDSGILQSGDEFDVTLDTPGTISYYCRLHPTMTGEIVVES